MSWLEKIVAAYFIVNFFGAIQQAIKGFKDMKLGKYTNDKVKDLAESQSMTAKVTFHIVTFLVNCVFWLLIRITKVISRSD